MTRTNIKLRKNLQPEKLLLRSLYLRRREILMEIRGKVTKLKAMIKKNLPMKRTQEVKMG